MCDYDRECRFIGEVMAPVVGPWNNMASTAFMSTPAFMSYVGLDKPPVEPSSDDINGQNRSQVSFYLFLYTWYDVVRYNAGCSKKWKQ